MNSMRRAIAAAIELALDENHCCFKQSVEGGVYVYTVLSGVARIVVRITERVYVKVILGKHVEKHEIDMGDPKFDKALMACIHKYDFLGSISERVPIKVRQHADFLLLYDESDTLIGFLANSAGKLVLSNAPK